MFSMTFGLIALVIAVLYREWGIQDEELGDYEDARYDAVLGFAWVLVAVIFIISGIGGV